MVSNKKNYDHLNLRRQFLITQDVCQELIHWQHEVFEKFQLYVHPDLELSISNSDHVKLMLIGFVIDPYHPEKSNTEVLSSLAKRIRTIDDVPDCLHSLSGRFVLLISIAQEIFVFHDPCGLRSVFYAQDKNKIHIGSQPTILEYVVPLKKGDNFATFNSSFYKNNHIEYWLPSNCSIYENIDRLVPNHYLKLNDLRQIRYWPTHQLQRKEIGEAVENASEILTNLIKAGSNRFNLALPLTAGWDSRLLLAACRDIANELYFYTLQYRQLATTSPDVFIPKKILNRLNFSHYLIDCNIEPSPAFKEQYLRNTSPAHEDWGKIAYGIFLGYPQDRVCIKGNCSEICRCFYYPSGKHPQIHTVEQIIELEKGWKELNFVREGLSAWFDEATIVTDYYHFDILDLFYWEHRMGSWQAQSQLEWDVAQEAFTPFNQRELLEIMLSVSTEYRCKQNMLYKKMIKQLWPQILKEPINPQKNRTLMGYYRDILKRLKYFF